MPSRWSTLALAVAVSVTFGVSPSMAQPAAPGVAPSPAGELVPFWLVRPDYIHIARAARLEGVVVLVATIGTDGRVMSTTVESGPPLLLRDAVAAAKDSGFLCRGCTGPMTYRFTYDFGLAATDDEILAARADLTPAAATMRILARPAVYDIGPIPRQALVRPHGPFIAAR
jgi:hypothetical protein